MPAYPAETVARFEDVLRKDPTSQVFAPLADAYRAESRLVEAEKLTSDGVRRHPEFAGGWVARGRVLRDLKRLDEAAEALRRALRIAPENLLALQMLGELALERKDPKEALKAFKYLLFINPMAEKAKRIVAKLESLTADEYEEEVFAMTKLAPVREEPAAILERPSGGPSSPQQEKMSPGEMPKGLVRMLSLIDAFVVRNDLGRASQLLTETETEFGDHPEIDQRRLLLQRRRASQLTSPTEHAEPLGPVSSREEMIRQRKIRTLQALLRTIESMKSDHSEERL